MSEDLDYFYRRTERELDVELDMAQRSIIPRAVQAQHTLATLYLERAYSEPVGR